MVLLQLTSPPFSRRFSPKPLTLTPFIKAVCVYYAGAFGEDAKLSKTPPGRVSNLLVQEEKKKKSLWNFPENTMSLLKTKAVDLGVVINVRVCRFGVIHFPRARL